MFIIPELPRSHADVLQLSLCDPARAVGQAFAVAGGRTSIADNYTLGCALLAQDRAIEARPFLEAALADCPTAYQDIIALHCQRALLKGSLDTLQPTDTASWEAIIAEYQAVGAVGEAARTAVHLASAWYNRRDTPEVHAVIDRWMPLLREDDHYERGCFSRLLGAALTNEKAFNEAERTLHYAKQLLERHSYLPELAHCWMIEGWASTLQGQFEKAQAHFERSEHVFKQYGLSIRQAFCANNRSICYLQQSKFPQTLFHAHQARQFFHKNNRLLDVGACDLVLGRVYLHAGHWVAARTEFYRAATIFSELNATGRLASCHYNTAYVMVEQGELSHAEETLRMARDIAEEFNNQEVLEAVMMLSVKCLTIKGDYHESLAKYEAAAAYFARQSNGIGEAFCALESGWIALELKDLAGASRAFAGALPILESQPSLAWRAMHGMARCTEASNDWPAALRWYRNATRIVNSIRHQLANEHLSSMLFNQALMLFFQATQCFLKHGTPLEVLQFTEQQRTMTLLRLQATKWQERNSDELHAIEEQLRIFLQAKHSPAHGQDLAENLDKVLREYARKIWLDRHSLPVDTDIDFPPTVDIADVRRECCRRHGSEWTILVYTTDETTFLLSVLTATDLWNIRLPWHEESEALAKKLNSDRYKWNIYQDRDFRSGKSTRPWHILETLGMTLLPEAVRERLNPDHRLYIVPSQVLHTLPWATLRVGDSWLCEQSILQIVPHLMFLTRPASTIMEDALFLGCSTFPMAIQQLAFVPEEIQHLTQVWAGPADVMLEEDCSIRLCEPKQSGRWRKYGVIHIATHAYMVKDQGIAGHIVLNDGNLWLDTISQLPIDRALVVLSTCSGAAMDMLSGEENLSLSWSWLIAGAAGVLASIWPVYDGSTLALLTPFYRHLTNGMDSAAALALAQRQCIRLNVLPTVWGSFVLTGGALQSRA
jgi:CHAT domain-containing protein/tetratricopeptide (TPR) repeat protein